MKSKRNTFFFITIFIVQTICGQNISSISRLGVMPRTPEVAALEKFVEYPVGYNTGTVNINVPLYSLELKNNLELPINISYHTSGVKVTDVSGRVGLGWALNAGGCISRDMRGKNDETPYSGFYSFICKHKDYKFPKKIDPYKYASLLDSIDRGIIDSEPDLFTVSLPAGSFKFFYGSDGEFHSIPACNMKISQTALDNANGYGSWTITDEYGNKFIFGEYQNNSAIEVTENVENGRRSVTSWKLLAIISAENKVLASFNYKEKTYEKRNIFNIYKIYNCDGISWEQRYPGTESPEGLLTIFQNFTFYEKDLSSIVLPGIGTVSFHTKKGNNDCSLIDSIALKDAISGKILGYNFVYENDYRHFLTRIIRYGTDIMNESYRKFEYYNGLPYGNNDKGQDLWGYYNGKDNAYLFPVEAYIKYPNKITHSDRYPNEKAICGSLKTIYYSTGGKTEFNYENNEVYVPYTETDYNVKSATDNIIADEKNYIGTYFQQAVNEQVKINISFALHPAGLITTTFELVDSMDNIIFKTTDNSLAYSSTRRPITTKEGYYLFDYSTNTVLSPGKYRWRVKYNTSHSLSIYPATITTKYYKSVAKTHTTIRKKILGGLRIASIINYGSLGEIIDTRRFAYEKSDGTSSGIEGPSPVFVRYYKELHNMFSQNSGASIQNPVKIGIEEINEQNLCRYNGSAIQYTDVIEDRIVDGNAIRIAYHYFPYTFEHALYGSELFKNSPYLLTFSDNSFSDGILSSRSLFMQKNNIFTKQQEENYNYENIGHPSGAYIQTGISLENIVKGGEDFQMTASDKYFCGTYRLISAKAQPSTTCVMQIIGKDTLMNKTLTTYCGYEDGYILPRQIETCVGSSKVATTSFHYCFDYGNNSIMDSLKSRNYVGNPIEVTNSSLGKTKYKETKYELQNNSFYKPSETLDICNGDTTKIQYIEYDDYGNPLHIVVNDYIHHYYLWSYQGKYPIAEIIGNDYTSEEVNSAVYSVFCLSSRNISDQLIPDIHKLRSDALQKLLPKATVNTFTWGCMNSVASITNSAGVSTMYDYDTLGRLEQILIPTIANGGSIAYAIKENFSYHYKGIQK